MQDLVDKYTSFTLEADLSGLSENQYRMISLMIDAADIMDEAFWRVAYTGVRSQLPAEHPDPATQEFIRINYGPWDRLNNDRPFIDGVGPKPKGANFYPVDMTKEEFEAAASDNPDLRSLYTLVRRDENGNLVAIPYHEAFPAMMRRASEKLQEAAELAEDPDFKRYLQLRAAAIVTDEYFESDMAWMEMRDNALDLVIGPIETYEDQLFGYKAAYEAFVLLKDQEWSRRLLRYAEVLPELQRGLPVPDEYKQETPGRDSDLGAYDVLYYAGDANAGSKTIAINLPNDERVQLQKGTRRLQLRNAMRAKFDKILLPIAGQLIDPTQQAHVTFDAFFNNTMFHEVAHGLGIKETINGRGPVRQALKERASALEEGKADVLGLYMVTSLHEQGELGDTDLMDFYVTFVSSIFRSIRFGASSAHGIANLIRYNYFLDRGAFYRSDEGVYTVDFDGMQAAIDALSERILRFQGDGDYEGVVAFVEEYGRIGPELQADLDGLSDAGIPVDVVFEQGKEVLGLENPMRR